MLKHYVIGPSQREQGCLTIYLPKEISWPPHPPLARWAPLMRSRWVHVWALDTLLAVARVENCDAKENAKANMHESSRTHFFMCLGNNISVASQTILLMLLNSIGWAKAGHWQHWDIEQASHPISVRENSDWSSKGGAGRGYPLLTLSNTLAIGWRSCL